jgi:hypothetical protein
MSMNVAVATARLSREMPEAEAAIEEALVASASLLLTAATARRDTGVRAAETHAALLRLNKLNMTLIEASGEARRAHRELRKLAEQPLAIDGTDCPSVIEPMAATERAA